MRGLRVSRALGAALLIVSPICLILYTLWIVGLIPWLDPELAVRVAVYLIVAALLIIMALLGYVMVTAPRPISVKGVKGSG